MDFGNELKDIRISPIVKISEEAKLRAEEFEKKGNPFIYFQRGEIDFPTPSYISDALMHAIEKGRTKYPKSGGEPFFQNAILEKLLLDNGVRGIGRENIVVTHGGQEGLELSFKLFRKGAGFSPIWSCILESIVPYSRIDFSQVPLKEDFSVDFDLVYKKIREVDFFYLNTPQNPTGKVFSEEEVREISEICKKQEKFLISDEAYDQIVFDNKKHFSAASLSLENIISCFTLSKTYSMTGWRIGYAVTRNKKAAEFLKRGNYSQTAGVATPFQYAAAEAIFQRNKSKSAIDMMVGEFQKRRDALYNEIDSVKGVKVNRPEGAFYMFPNFTDAMPSYLQGTDRQKYVSNLLMENGIAVVPGCCFGKGFDDNIRISFSTTPVPLIREAGKRFREIFGKKTLCCSEDKTLFATN